MKTEQAPDVVVIGSGAGGSAAAWALTRHGLQVLLLEAGPAYDPSRDYRLHTNEWEQSWFPEKVATGERQSFAQLQLLESKWEGLRSWNALSGRLNPDDRRKSRGYLHVVGLGGSTLHFTGEAHRLHPASMQMHSRFGVAADWPFDYAALEPYYTLAERVLGVAGPKTDPVRVRSTPYPLPAHPPSFASRTIGSGCRKLGLNWTPNALAVLSQPYDGRPGCNYCANCNRGCPRQDKGSVDVTFLRQVRNNGNCTIRTDCRVTWLEAGSGDRVTAVHYIDSSGDLHRLNAPMVIVACGAVETPRLLLASTNQNAPDGLANESGQVGRHFMETLAWSSSGLHPQPQGSHRGLPADSICWDYNAPDAIPDVIGGCRFTPAAAENDLVGPLSYARRVVGGWGREHKASMREDFGRVLSVGAIGESLPNTGSFVDLDPDRRDALGIPLARIHSHLDENEIRRLNFMARTCREILEAAGVEKIFEEFGTYDFFYATHVFGTCRMGKDPAQSVVNEYGQSHRWQNLYVLDASVFPSSGGGEAPSLTIEALAIRGAESIVKRIN